MTKPYLSVVATTRNDNHGGDLLKRTTCFVEGIYHQAKQFNLAIELIIIEWNPPVDNQLLKDVLPKPQKGCPVILRYIIVPNEIHMKYKMADRMPLFQMTAKNVGIRLAKGEFILCTNIDLLFSNEIFNFLSKKELEEGSFYRANRVDVPAKIMEFDTFEDKLDFGKKNVIEVLGNRKGHEYIFGLPKFFYGFETMTRIINQVYKRALKLVYDEENFGMFTLDTSACGDFTLMHKNDWLRIEGYPELDLYSIHIDSMGVIAARAIGLKQVTLSHNLCSYHIYHENGWESFKKSPIDLIRFIEKKPGLDWYSIYETGKWMIKNKTTWGLNEPNWGFSEEKFKEYIFDAGKEVIQIN